MPEDNLVFASVTELSKLLRAKKISSVELTKMFLDRLEKLGPRYNALAELTPGLALREARRADRAIRGGEVASPLLGVPYGAKDLLATKNIPTRWGAPPYRNQVFDYDATAIRRLREAGAVLIGKLALIELAGGGLYRYASASLNGPGLNPWNIKHWAGGSSSGSGSAVAGGLVPCALGSDTAGSIVSPSAYCGITGLWPTWGLVSRYGAMELAWSMDTIGPMGRSAEDCAHVLQAIAGYDVQDISTIGHTFQFRPQVRRKEFRLGVLPLDYASEPATEKVFEAALGALRTAGMKITRAELPNYPYADIVMTVLHGEALGAHEELIKSEKLNELVDEGQKEALRKYAMMSITEYTRAQRQRTRAAQAVLDLFGKFDALVVPSLVSEATTIDADLSARPRARLSYMALGALAGVPCLSVPMGFGPRGLPLGLLIIGNRFAENTVLQIGMAFQRETDWHRMRPAEAVGV